MKALLAIGTGLGAAFAYGALALGVCTLIDASPTAYHDARPHYGAVGVVSHHHVFATKQWHPDLRYVEVQAPNGKAALALVPGGLAAVHQGFGRSPWRVFRSQADLVQYRAQNAMYADGTSEGKS